MSSGAMCYSPKQGPSEWFGSNRDGTSRARAVSGRRVNGPNHVQRNTDELEGESREDRGGVMRRSIEVQDRACCGMCGSW